MGWYQDGTLLEYPVMPMNYFLPEAEALLEEYRQCLLKGESPDFPEEAVAQIIDNTWVDSARSLIAGWIGHVYQTTHMDRTRQFMDGVDPGNPLGIE